MDLAVLLVLFFDSLICQARNALAPIALVTLSVFESNAHICATSAVDSLAVVTFLSNSRPIAAKTLRLCLLISSLINSILSLQILRRKIGFKTQNGGENNYKP